MKKLLCFSILFFVLVFPLTSSAKNYHHNKQYNQYNYNKHHYKQYNHHKHYYGHHNNYYHRPYRYYNPYYRPYYRPYYGYYRPGYYKPHINLGIFIPPIIFGYGY
ncbi:MAG: hypothetical protein V3U54_04050 [Thermodesulfobacteriota bacterium]